MSCCGQPEPRRTGTTPRLPTNPTMRDGVRVLYLGASRVLIEGSSSGLTYHADARSREFTVHRDDVRDLVRGLEFIRAPR